MIKDLTPIVTAERVTGRVDRDRSRDAPCPFAQLRRVVIA